MDKRGAASELVNYCQRWGGGGTERETGWEQGDERIRRTHTKCSLGFLKFLCLSFSQSLQQQGRGDGRWERYCDSNRECAIEKKHLSGGWNGCYDNYLYSTLSVMFHWSLERRRGMRGIGGGGFGEGSFLHLSAEQQCKFDCQSWR